MGGYPGQRDNFKKCTSNSLVKGFKWLSNIPWLDSVLLCKTLMDAGKMLLHFAQVEHDNGQYLPKPAYNEEKQINNPIYPSLMFCCF